LPSCHADVAVAALVPNYVAINNFAHHESTRESNILIVPTYSKIGKRRTFFAASGTHLRFEADLSGGESSESGTTVRP